MSTLREAAYRIDPGLWVSKVLGVDPAPWQLEFLRAPAGASIIALTARQVGKTTTASWAIAHYMLFTPGGMSVIACPAIRQSAEAVRRVREILVKVGAKLTTDNVYTLELDNGSRVLALPGSDDSIRGLTVDGWIVADEAARLTDDLISACGRCGPAASSGLAMLSTAWSRTDPFWMVWAERRSILDAAEGHRRCPGVVPGGIPRTGTAGMGEHRFSREYLGIPVGA